MTMIAMQESEKFPVIIGDILSSSNVKKDFTFPSYNTDVNIPISNGYYPCKLTQKIYIVHSNIAVAIAGNYDMNKKFVENIKKFFYNKEATKTNLDMFVSSYMNRAFKDDAYGICRVDPDSLEIEYRYFGAWKSVEYEDVGKFSVIGSGASDFIKTTARFGKENLLKVNSYHDAVSNIYLLLSSVLGDERYFANNIQNLWGAGFEMIVFDYEKGEFVKIDDITYIIWKSKYDGCGDKFECTPLSVMTNKYIGEALSISCHMGKQPNMFIVLPIYMNKTDFDLSKIPKQLYTKSDKVCNIFQVEIVEKDIIQSVCVYTESNSVINSVFIDYNEKNQFCVAISKELECNIKEQIGKMFS